MEWFKRWFNTTYYHLLYGKRNDEEAAFFLTNLLSQLKLQPQARCWDLNCGKGRHAVYLNKKGFEVIGTDLSEENIKYALQSENEKLHFYKHDMRGLFYANYFDAVFNLFTSFGYFKSKHDDEKVFQSVANSLKPGGLFVLDFLNATRVIESASCDEEKKIDDISFRITKKTENNFIVKEIKVTDNGKEHVYTEEVRAFTLPDFEALAQKAGLKLKNKFGNYAMQPFDENYSERLILIFVK